MKKISFLIAFLFLSSIICFSQDEHFDPLDELGSGYGNREIERTPDHEINFPNHDLKINNNNKNYKKHKKLKNQTPQEKFDALMNKVQAKANAVQSKDEYANINSHEKNANAYQRINIENYKTSNKDEIKDNGNEYSKIKTYDTELTNYKRFKNSSCFNEIGFNPTWDIKSLEMKYKECENEHKVQSGLKIIFILCFILIVLLVVFYSLPLNLRNILIQKIKPTK
jgi:hypothetical protein